MTNIQPLPDYISVAERQALENGVWNDIPELFIPSVILEIVRKIIQSPDDINITLLIAALPRV